MREVCPVVNLGLSIHNRTVIRIALTSPLNRHVTREEHKCPDEMLPDSAFVRHHVLHGGVGRLSPQAMDFLKGKGIEKVEAELIP